jgi:hypothetical protein
LEGRDIGETPILSGISPAFKQQLKMTLGQMNGIKANNKIKRWCYYDTYLDGSGSKESPKEVYRHHQSDNVHNHQDKYAKLIQAGLSIRDRNRIFLVTLKLGNEG